MPSIVVVDDDTGKRAKQITFSLNVEKVGKYDVFLGYLAYENRASNVPVTVAHADGETSVAVDQRANDRGWRKLGICPEKRAGMRHCAGGSDAVTGSIKCFRYDGNYGRPKACILKNHCLAERR